jgi:hypothetical protein
MLLVEQMGLVPADLVTLTSATFKVVQVGSFGAAVSGSFVTNGVTPVALTVP